MLATSNSPEASTVGSQGRPVQRGLRLARQTALLRLWILLGFLPAGMIPKDSPVLVAGEPPSPATHAQDQFLTHRTRFEQDRTNVTAAWQFARVCFGWAEFARDRDHRAEIAQQGIAAARRALVHNPDLAEARYYLGMNLGQLARTKHVGALKLVQEMEVEFKTAAQLDPKLDHAGPHRALGQLYRDAPGWPASIGSKTRARTHLERAIELAPDYPGNRLLLAEAYQKWGEKRNLEASLTALEELMPRVRKFLSGPEWAGAWIEWEERWTKLRVPASEKLPRRGRG